MPIPVYTRRFWSIKNFAGTFELFNPGPDAYIVHTVTVYCGALSICEFFLVDENDVLVLHATLDPTGTSQAVWHNLRLYWPAGATWATQTSFGCDMTGHGYQLSPP